MPTVLNLRKITYADVYLFVMVAFLLQLPSRQCGSVATEHKLHHGNGRAPQ